MPAYLGQKEAWPSNGVYGTGGKESMRPHKMGSGSESQHNQSES